MKYLIAIAVLLSAQPSVAATALWTGETRYTTSVTFQSIIACRYHLYGNFFWRYFKADAVCPSEVEVE